MMYLEAMTSRPVGLSSRSAIKFHYIHRRRMDSVWVKCTVCGDKLDSFYMKRCVEIAKHGLGLTNPNPMVGCVIVKDGKIVGEGFHPKAGEPHAEVFALKDAGLYADNATVYVSLEPCNHHGRTPPCTEALIKAKVRSVVVGMVDPNPLVASKGVERLKGAGIDVKVGVEEELCRKLNESYVHRMITMMPFVTIRFSLSVNGELQSELGEGAEEHGGYYSDLLKKHDGIIVPRSFLSKVSSKAEVICSEYSPEIVLVKLLKPSSLFSDTSLAGMVTIFKEKNSMVELASLMNFCEFGVEVVVLDVLDLKHVLDYCIQQHLCSILVDARDGNLGKLEEIITGGLKARLVQKLVVEILPYWGQGRPSVPFRSMLRRSLSLGNLKTRTSSSVVVEGDIYDGEK